MRFFSKRRVSHKKRSKLSECVSVCVCVYGSERERERVCVCVRACVKREKYIDTEALTERGTRRK